MALFHPSAGVRGLVHSVFIEAGAEFHFANSAGIRIGGVWTAPYSGSVTGIRAGDNGPVGSGTGIVGFELYACGADHLPTGSALASGTADSAYSFRTYTFGTPYTVTAGSEYAFVLRNLHATPASNYFRAVKGLASEGIAPFCAAIGSNDAGATWDTFGNWQMSQRFSVSARMFPIYAVQGIVGPKEGWTSSTGFTTALYNASGSRVARLGVQVNFGSAYKLHGFKARVSKTGSPTFRLKGEVVDDAGNVVATSATTATSATLDNQWVAFSFEPAYTLLAGRDYYVVVTPDGATAGDASNYAKLESAATFMDVGSIGPVIKGVSSTGTTISWSNASATYTDMTPSIGMFVEPVGGGIKAVDFAGGYGG